MNNQVDSKLYDSKDNISSFQSYKLKKDLQSTLETYFPTEIIFFDGRRREDKWMIVDKNGELVLHNSADKPALIQYYENGEIMLESWFHLGKVHREADKPAEIYYFRESEIEKKLWNEDDDDEDEENLNIKKEKWYTYGSLTHQIEYYNNGKKNQERWFQNDKLHSRADDEPALIIYNNNRYNDYNTRVWYENGKEKRDDNKPTKEVTTTLCDGCYELKFYKKNILVLYKHISLGHMNSMEDDNPCYIEYYDSGKKKEERWCNTNKLDRKDDKPSQICYYESGNIKTKKWYKLDELRLRSDQQLPNCMYFYDNKSNSLEKEEWIDYKTYRRDDHGPAYIEYYENGNVKCKRWYINGNLARQHKLPAVIEYDENGNETCKKYYKLGELIKEEK